MHQNWAKVLLFGCLLCVPRAIFSMEWFSRTVDRARVLSQVAETHNQLSTARDQVLQKAYNDIRQGGTTASAVLASGAGLLSVLSWLPLRRVPFVAPVGLVCSCAAACATFLASRKPIKRNPQRAAYLYPSVAAICATRGTLELGARGYCFVGRVNSFSTGASFFNSWGSGHHQDTQQFMRELTGL